MMIAEWGIRSTGSLYFVSVSADFENTFGVA